MSEKPEKHAVVLSGGGANGAYEIGVLKALVSGESPTTGYKSIDPEFFLGTSVGAFNAAFLVSKWKSHGSTAVAKLERVWIERLSSTIKNGGNGVFRAQGDPLSFLNPYSYFPNPFKPMLDGMRGSRDLAWDTLQRVVNLTTDTKEPVLERAVNLLNFSSFISMSPLEAVVREEIDYADIRTAEKELHVAATDWGHGKVKIFRKREMTDTQGPQAILASAAIPGLFPVQKVGADGFVDGGVLMNSPIKPAIEAGADVIHIMTLNPEVAKIPLTSMSNTMTTLWRQQVIGWVRAVENGLNATYSDNQTRELTEDSMIEIGGIEKLKGEQEALVKKMDAEEKRKGSEGSEKSDNKEKLRRKRHLTRLNEKVKAIKPVTVYLYRPDDDLGGPLGLLDFAPERIKMLIERGFADTQEWERRDGENFVPAKPLYFGETLEEIEDPKMHEEYRKHGVILDDADRKELKRRAHNSGFFIEYLKDRFRKVREAHEAIEAAEKAE